MRFPPKLSAGQLFWVGLALCAGGLIVTALMAAALYSSVAMASLVATTGSVISGIVQILTLVGAGLMAGSFVVRHIETREETPGGRGAPFGADEVPENWTDGRR